jgi:hypothetical protein
MAAVHQIRCVSRLLILKAAPGPVCEYDKREMKISPVGAELFHANRRTDEQTDITKLIVAFRNFANAPKKHKVKEGTETSLQDNSSLKLDTGHRLLCEVSSR